MLRKESKLSLLCLNSQTFILIISLFISGSVFFPATGTSQTVTVQPVLRITREASPLLTICSNDLNFPSFNLQLSGAGTAGKLVLSPKKLTFPKVAVGSTQTRNLTFRNTGEGVLEGTVGTLNPPFEVLSGGGSFSLASGSIQAVTVQFAPTAAGKATATLTVTSNDPKLPSVSVPVSGTGTALSCPIPGAASNPSPSVGATEVLTDLTLSWAASSNADSYDVYCGTSSNQPLAGNTASTSYPLSGLTNNTKYYWKVVAKNNCGKSKSGPIWTFTTEKGVPEIIVDTITLSFGSAPAGRESTPREVNVRNNGTGHLIINTINLSGATPDQFIKVSDSCSNQVLASSESCMVGVSFRPTSSGEKNATLVIPSNDTDKNRGTVALIGVEGETLGRFRLSTRGLWGDIFDRRGWTAGYYSGQVIQEFNDFDPVVGHTVAEEVALQLDKMRAMGVNTITFGLLTADPGCDNGSFPQCHVCQVSGFQWPHPTPTELANLGAFFDLVHVKGIRIILRPGITHMEEQPPVNSQAWLGAILGVVKDHPALDLIVFYGDEHVLDLNGDGIPDACGGVSEPPLWMGPTGVGSQYVKWAISYALSLDIPARKLSAGAIVNDFFTDSQPGNPWGTDGHLWSPIVTLKKIFDDLGVPNNERTYALSFYEHRKCATARDLPCIDTDPHAWAEQTLESVFATIGMGNGARVVALEMGDATPVDPMWPTEHAVESLIVLMEKYGVDGGSFWTWVNSDNNCDANPQWADPVKRRGIEFIYTPVQKEVVDMGGFHLTAIPNGSFEKGDSVPSNWAVSGNGTGVRYFLAAESGQPDVPTRGNYALRLITGSGPNDALSATSDKIAVTPNTAYTTTANLRFGWTGDPNPQGVPSTRPQVFISIQYFDGTGGVSQVRTQDVFRFYQENSTTGFDTFPLQYITPSDASFVRIEVGAARNGLSTEITFDVDNLR